MNPKKAKNLDKILPILAVDGETDIIVSKNADLTAAFELKAPEIFAVSDGEYDSLHDILVRATKVLPLGYMVHKQDLFIEDEYLPDFSSEYLQANNSVAWANEQHFAERAYMRHRCYLFVTRPALSPLKRTTTNSSLLKRHLVPKELKEPRTWAEFMDVVNQFGAIFNDSSKIRLDRLRKEAIIGDATHTGLYQSYFSLSFNDPTLHDLEIVRRQAKVDSCG